MKAVLWVVPPSKTKPGEPGDPISFLLRSVVSGRKIPQSSPIKLSIHKKSGSLRTSNWCPYIRIAWHHLNLPHGFFHVAQDTPFAQGSPPPPFAPGLRPPVGPRPLRPSGYFSWKGQCFHDCHDISCLSELSDTIQFIQFDNDEPNKHTHLFLTKSKTCFNTKLCCMRITLMLSCRCPPSPSTGPPNQLPHWPWKPIRLGEENRYPKWTTLPTS